MFKREMSNQKESELTLTQKQTHTDLHTCKQSKTWYQFVGVTVKVKISFSTRLRSIFILANETLNINKE